MPSDVKNASSVFPVTNPSRYMTITYVASLSLIAVLSIVVHFMLDKVIVEQSKTGAIVNISGQQRMLSQRASLFAVEYILFGDGASKELAIDALEKMKANHSVLTRSHFENIEIGAPSSLSPTLEEMYFDDPLNVHESLKLFEKSLMGAISQPSINANVELRQRLEVFINMSRDSLLSSLDLIVKQYELESLKRVNELRVAQNVVLGIIILIILIEAVFVFRPMVLKVSSFARRIQHDANHDHLSNLLNRRAFYLLAEQIVASSQRKIIPYSVIMIDIDHFKNINDNFGHDAGDLAIKHVSNILLKTSRASDVVARFGGEEFVFLLQDSSEEGAMIVSEKLRLTLSENPVLINDEPISITVSCGVSVSDIELDDINNMITKADKALYQAKQTGRNKSCLYSKT